MRAITLWQPWASLVIGGYKKFETRSWYTRYRGPLAIHAAKQEPSWIKVVYEKPPTSDWREWAESVERCIREMGYVGMADLPRGVILGTSELYDVRSTSAIRNEIPSMERIFGDWSDGRWAGRLTKLERFDEPIPVRGWQGLWTWGEHDRSQMSLDI